MGDQCQLLLLLYKIFVVSLLHQVDPPIQFNGTSSVLSSKISELDFIPFFLRKLSSLEPSLSDSRCSLDCVFCQLKYY